MDSQLHMTKKSDLKKLVLYFVRRYPAQTLFVTFCLLIAGMVEGVSIALVLTLLDVAMGQEAGMVPGLSTWVRKALEWSGTEPSLPILLALIVGGISLKSMVKWAAMRHAGYAVATVSYDLRSELLSALMKANWSHFVSAPGGHYANALGVEVKIAANAYQNMASAIASLVQLLIYTAIAVFAAWQTAVLAVGTGGFIMLVLRPFVRTGWYAGRGQIVAMKTLVARMADALNTFKPIKAMAGEHKLQAILVNETKSVTDALRLKVMAVETLSAIQEPIMIFVMALGLYVAIEYFDMPLSLLMVQAFLFQRLVFQSNQLLRSIQVISSEESALWSLRNGIEKAASACEADSHDGCVPSFDRDLVFSGVDFKYGQKTILDNVSMKVRAGNFVLITGPSGTGKTTVLDLMAGLLVPQNGSISIDGVPVKEVNMRLWREMVGYVAQEMGLLHESVLNNVTLRDNRISREDVEQALRDSEAWEFVCALDGGMDAMVGERGSKLSGGQRQRIALARALVRRPRLLLLDEITASLDPASEQAICRTLSALHGRMTIVAVSHQEALHGMADQIFRLENGLMTREIKQGSSAG